MAAAEYGTQYPVNYLAIDVAGNGTRVGIHHAISQQISFRAGRHW